jgi:hypothetical protein
MNMNVNVNVNVKINFWDEKTDSPGAGCNLRNESGWPAKDRPLKPKELQAYKQITQQYSSPSYNTGEAF